MSLFDYMQAIYAKMVAQRKAARKNRIGPGQYSTPRLVQRQACDDLDDARRLPGTVIQRMGDYTGEQLRNIRAKVGVGRPPRQMLSEATWTPSTPFKTGDLVKMLDGSVREVAGSCTVSRPPLVDYTHTAALEAHGSQRKAAAALGMNLSTFQRALKKEQADAEAL
jgi:hypothetical protein